jgi:hypothetical protein
MEVKASPLRKLRNSEHLCWNLGGWGGEGIRGMWHRSPDSDATQLG